MTDDELLIGELARETGVSIRTIRYYMEEGLLPPSRARGKYAVFDNEYIDRVHLIRIMKETYYLPLKEIRRQVENLNPQEIKDLLAKYEEGNPADQAGATPNKAVDYISRLMNRQAENSQTRRAVMPPAAPSPLSVQAAPPRESWQHIPLADGLELHIRQPVSTEEEAHIQELVDLAKKLFPFHRSGGHHEHV